MKTVQLNDFEKQVLLAEKEAISIEHNGKLIGYYYPVVDYQKVKEAKQELDALMEKVLAQTGLTEEEFIETFMKADKNLCD